MSEDYTYVLALIVRCCFATITETDPVVWCVAVDRDSISAGAVALDLTAGVDPQRRTRVTFTVLEVCEYDHHTQEAAAWITHRIGKAIKEITP